MTKQRITCVLCSSKFQRLCNTGAIAVFLAIVVIGSLPGARDGLGKFASGVVLHSVAYAILGLLTFIGGNGSGTKRAFWTVLKVAAMGAIDEGVQSLFPYRTAALGDWLIDVTAGVVISFMLWKYWPKDIRQCAANRMPT
jgi:VanZ family protein